jgi:glutathione S-transferase
MIKLYTFPPSTNSRKVRIALIEKGLEFERINIDLTKREQKNPDYLKIHPFGQIPALDDEFHFDSAIITNILKTNTYPPSCRATPAGARAHDGRLRDAISTLTCSSHSREPQTEAERDAQRIDNAKLEITKAFDRIEQNFHKDYLTGFSQLT